jgi:hypothetical protein
MGQRLENPRPSWPDMGFGSCSGDYDIAMKSLKTTKVRQAKCQDAPNVARILTDLDMNASKPLRPVDLKYLGYVFDKTNAPAVTGTGYQLWRILDEDTKREASFCFVLAKKPNVGVVLPHPFSRYAVVNEESPTSQDASVVKGESPTGTANA